MKKNLKLEQMLNSELDEVKGGQTDDTCVCENGGAGATIIIIEEPDPSRDPILV